MKYRMLGVLCAAVLSVGLLAGCGTKDTAESTKTEEGTSVSQEEEEPVDEEAAEAAGFTDGAEEGAAGTETDADAETDTVVLNTDEPLTGKHYAELVIEDYGTITMELDADSAPITVTNFVKLAQEGFYDGLTFHRIMEGFMMQGGDPNGNGTGGSDETIKGEFSNNGVDNPLSHTRGAVSMARSSLPDSASSQFFIVHKDSTFLDGDYAVFGYVTEGMDVVDSICEAAEPTDNNGTIPSDEQPVIETIKIID